MRSPQPSSEYHSNLSALYETHYDTLLTYAVSLRGVSRDDAYDLIHEVFEGLLVRDIDWSRQHISLAYLSRSVWNCWARKKRHANVRDRASHLLLTDPIYRAPSRTEEEEYILREELQCMTQIVTTLPARHREVMIRRYWHDQPNREIAAALGISEKTVRQYLTEARNMIRKKIRLCRTRIRQL